MKPKAIKVPFLDLAAHHRPFAAAFRKKLDELVRSSQFILGDELEAFEKEFAAYLGVKHAVGVSNGTDALRLACEAIGLKPGEEVIVPAYTFIATAFGVTAAGGTPRFVDVSEDTFNLDPEKVEKAITPRTRAILPVHLFGHPADMDPILTLAKRHGLRVIEDAAQAHGATYQGRKAGGIGD
ncbi:MAG TPA: aminotransferase class I/II-fold pyridoxal phosphate-dependent enzyme, partial [Planctomycetota bacterium]|nr:aminotransferase class I/II-fold pyridoxal phosphate-dependent enzyme [Planctomycetota bacterium]